MDHDPGKWSAWLDEHAAALVLLARQRSHSHAEAEDIVQDAFVRFWPKRDSARNARAYLYACVRTAAMDRRRGAARRQRREQAVALAADANQDTAGLFEDTAEQDERREAIERALTALPVSQKEVVVMKIWGELTFQDIGEALAIPANTAASRYRYALATLKESLHEEQVR